MCSWSYIYKEKYYLLLDHIVYLEKEASLAHKCFLGPSVGIWKIILLGGRELKGEYRCPVNQDIKKKGEAVMWQWLVGENLANSRERIGRYDNLGNVCIIYKCRLILSISCSSLAGSVFNLPLAVWGCAIDHTLCEQIPERSGERSQGLIFAQKSTSANQVKPKGTAGLRLTMRAVQAARWEESWGELLCELQGSGLYHHGELSKTPRSYRVTTSQREGLHFLDFHLPFCLLFYKSRCFLH